MFMSWPVTTGNTDVFLKTKGFRNDLSYWVQPRGKFKQAL